MDKKFVEEAEARRQICETGRRMYQKGFVAANDGNLSVRLSGKEILCTPTGVSKGFMNEADLIVVDPVGQILRGVGKPSSEMKMHLRVYEENPEIQAVVHAHPVNATALAVSGISLEEPILTESVVVLGRIPLAPYAAAGTDEVPASVAPFCRDYNGALLANHGAVTWGETLEKAWFRMESLEQAAEIYIKSKYLIGRANILNNQEVLKLQERYGIVSGRDSDR